MKFAYFISFIYFSALGLILQAEDRDFHSKKGPKINGTIIKYYEDGDVLLKRSKDMQLFRISLDIFTEDDQAFVKNNFPFSNLESTPKLLNISIDFLSP